MRKRARKERNPVGHDAVLAWEADFSDEEDGGQAFIDQHGQVLDESQQHAVEYSKAAQVPRHAKKKAKRQLQQQQQHQQHQLASIGTAGTQQAMPWKPFLLFDLNGVLVSERTTGKKRRDSWQVRPGIEALLQLREKYTIGLFSSATPPTIRTALQKVIEAINAVTGNAISKKASHHNRQQIAQQRRCMPEWMKCLLQQYTLNGMKGLPWFLTHEDRLFQVVLTRNQCKSDPTHTTRPDGNPWDTVKPLQENGFPVNRVLLVDNELRKAGPGEQKCMLLIPTWERCQDQGVAAWQELVSALLQLPIDPDTDLRQHTSHINTRVAAVAAAAGTVTTAETPTKLLCSVVTEEEDVVLSQGIGLDQAVEIEQVEAASEPPRKLRRTTDAVDVQTGAVADPAPSMTQNRYQLPVVTSDGYLLADSTDVDNYYGSEQDDDETLPDGMEPSQEDDSQSDAYDLQFEQSEEFNSDDTDSFDSASELDIGIGELSDYAEDEDDEDLSLPRDGYDPHELEISYQSQPGHKRGRQLTGAIPLYNGPRNLPNAAGMQQAFQRQPGVGHQLSELHYEIARFAAETAPSDGAIQVIQAAVAAVQAAAQAVWPSSRAVLFGSQACGVALPGSDLDVVVLGAMRDVDTPKQLKQQKHQASKCLGKLIKKLRQTHILESYEIIPANVPIIKAKLRVDGLVQGSNNKGKLLAVDIGIGAANGVAGAALMQCAVLAAPWLRPLCLVIKALLKSAGLNEVFTAGLSSWGIINMVLSHLQCEQLAPDQHIFAHTLEEDRQAVHDTTQQQLQVATDANGDVAVNHQQQGRHQTHDLQQFLRQVRQSSLQQINTPCQGIDLGDLLISFLYRLGHVFDPSKEMISVRRGGVRWLSTSMTHTPNRIPGRKHTLGCSQVVHVEDPQQAGRNACAASTAWPLVRVTLRAALQRIIARNRNEDPCVALPLHIARAWGESLHIKSKQKKAPKSVRFPHIEGPVTRVGSLGAALYRSCTKFGRQRDMYFCHIAKICESWEGWSSDVEPPPLAMRAHIGPSVMHHHTQQHHQHSQHRLPHQAMHHQQNTAGVEALHNGALTEEQLWEMVQQDGSHQSMAVPEIASCLSSDVRQMYPQLGTLFDVTAVLCGSGSDKQAKAHAKANRPHSSAKQRCGKGQLSKKQKAALMRLNNREIEEDSDSSHKRRKWGRHQQRPGVMSGNSSLVSARGQKQNKRQLKIKAAKQRRVQAAHNQRAAASAARQQQ